MSDTRQTNVRRQNPPIDPSYQQFLDSFETQRPGTTYAHATLTAKDNPKKLFYTDPHIALCSSLFTDAEIIVQGPGYIVVDTRDPEQKSQLPFISDRFSEETDARAYATVFNEHYGEQERFVPQFVEPPKSRAA